MTRDPVPLIEPEAPPVDGSDILDALLHYKWLIVFGTLSSALLSGLLSYAMKPVFRAEVLMMPVTQRGSTALPDMISPLGGLAAIAGFSMPSSQREEALATLQSRLLTDTFIRERQLLPVLYPRAWNAQAKTWDADKPPTLWDAYERFNKSIRRVAESRKTGLVSLSIDWTDSVAAAEWANALVALTNQMLRQRAIENSTRNIRYIEDQLTKVSMLEMRQALYRLLEAEYKNIMLAQGTEEYAFKVIDPAVPPHKKHKPNRTVMVCLGAAVGLVLAVLSALALQFRKKRVPEVLV